MKQINTKWDMVQKLASGGLGNTSHVCFYPSEMIEGKLYMVRYYERNMANQFVYRKGDDVYMRTGDKSLFWSKPSRSFYLHECIFPSQIDFQFEVYRSDRGLVLQYSYDRKYARECNWKTSYGFSAQNILQAELKESYDVVEELLMKYGNVNQSAIVEGARAILPVGVEKKNLVIWEVRSY